LSNADKPIRLFRKIILLVVLTTSFLALLAILNLPNNLLGGQRSEIIHWPPGQPSGIKPYYSMGDDDRRTFLEKVNKIKVGDSRGMVLSLLGTPTVESHDATNWPRPHKSYHEFSWYLTIWEKGLVNERFDEYVFILFDEKDEFVQEVEVFLRPRIPGEPTTRWGQWPLK
jgi:hypothetical protein